MRLILSKRRNQRGNLALIAALAMLPIALVTVNGVNIADITRVKSSLQAAADAGALAGAGELGIATRGNDGIIQTAVNFANTSANIDTEKTPSVFTATVDDKGGSVTVNGSYLQESIFGSLAGGDREIRVTATAEALRNMPLCVLQTGYRNSRSSAEGLCLSDGATIRAPGCLVQANESISVSDNARIEAGRVSAVGSAKGTIMPAGNVGAIPIADPFKNLTIEATTDCPNRQVNYVLREDASITLQPGTHCGHYTLRGEERLTLAPGEHYFMGGLRFTGRSVIRGEDVVLIFGDRDTLDLSENTEVRLKARKSGPFAGFLIATTRDNNTKFTISSNRVRELLGTIYIPNAELEISTTAPVAEDSAWSVIVARRLTLINNPTLVINKSYITSGVQVPKGVGPSNSNPRLTQ